MATTPSINFPLSADIFASLQQSDCICSLALAAADTAERVEIPSGAERVEIPSGAERVEIEATDHVVVYMSADGTSAEWPTDVTNGAAKGALNPKIRAITPGHKFISVIASVANVYVTLSFYKKPGTT